MKYISEIIKSIKTKPEIWTPNVNPTIGFTGIKKDNIEISGYGNTRALSIINVYIDGHNFPVIYIDKWRLESVVHWWAKNADLKHMAKT